MNPLQNLEQEYHALAQQHADRLEQEFDAMTRYMQGSTAIHHGEYVRSCYIPKLFTEQEVTRLAADMKILYAIFAKVMARYYAEPAVRALFGFDARTEELILRSDPSRAMLPMARIDFFYDDATGEYTFCEFNADGASAMNEDRELHRAQQLSTCYRAFCAKHTTRSCELFDSWVETVLRIWCRVRGTDAVPQVAICDVMECGTVNEFHVFQSHFEAAGIPCEVCDVRALRYDEAARALYAPSGRKIDVIYRRAVTSDLLDHYGECTALLQAVRQDAVLLVGDFHTQLVHNKTLFRVLYEPEILSNLAPEEQEYVRRHVPFTQTFTAQDAEAVAQQPEGWILKPWDSYGSRGVMAGVEYTPEQWREVVQATPTDGSYLMQRFHMPFVTQNYGLADGMFGKHRYYNLTGLYVYDGVVQGVYSRVSLSPIISSQYSEKTLPTLLVDAEQADSL